jgi:hypothetical protein
VQSLTALFRTAGVYKQNGTPTAPFAFAFHFTGTAWTVHPFGLAKIGQRITKVERQLHESYAIQRRLEFGENQLELETAMTMPTPHPFPGPQTPPGPPPPRST